ncbi:MAG: hypothetical protein ACYSWW_22715 [Planctomycetota bacterium]|jgi:hypothetical protein
MSCFSTKDDYLRACEITKAVIDEWDPYSLLRQGCPSDEFADPASLVVCHIPQMGSVDDAIYVISQVFSKEFEPEYFRPEHCKEVGTKLYRTLQDEGFLG